MTVRYDEYDEKSLDVRVDNHLTDEDHALFLEVEISERQ